MHVSVTGPQDAVQFLEKEYHAMFTNAEKRQEVKQRQMDAMVSGDGWYSISSERRGISRRILIRRQLARHPVGAAAGREDV